MDGITFLATDFVMKEEQNKFPRKPAIKHGSSLLAAHRAKLVPSSSLIELLKPFSVLLTCSRTCLRMMYSIYSMYIKLFACKNLNLFDQLMQMIYDFFQGASRECLRVSD